MIRGLVRTALAALVAAAFSAAPAYAGNIALTGHDDDFHCFSLANPSCIQLGQFMTFVRAGSTIPTAKVLSFDQGSELTADLTLLGIAFDNISNPALVTAALFDPTVYSAFVVASHITCGGCDNTDAMNTALNAQTAAIASFFNAGGGIVALSGAQRAGTAPLYYGFLPQTASGFGSPPSSPYFGETCFGIAFAPVNGDPTHNFFPEPGTSGVSSAYCVAERFGNALTGTAESLVLQGGTIVTDIIITTVGAAVPEPATLTLFGLGAAVAAYRRRRRS